MRITTDGSHVFVTIALNNRRYTIQLEADAALTLAAELDDAAALVRTVTGPCGEDVMKRYG